MDLLENNSQKKIKISKERFEKEKKLHTGTGKNNKCTNTDIADIMLVDPVTVSNYKYEFPVDRLQMLCDKWGVRIEYLQGIDEYRNIDEMLIDYDKKEIASIKKSIAFCELLGFKVVLDTIGYIKKADYKEEYGKVLKEIDGYYILKIIPTWSNSVICDSSFNALIYKNGELISTMNITSLKIYMNTLLKNDSALFDLFLSNENSMARTNN